MGINTFCQTLLESANPILQNVTISNTTTLTPADLQLIRLKVTFRTIMISISVVGVGGNILNLMTLRSPSLRTVPFKYIRALAVYDLVGLILSLMAVTYADMLILLLNQVSLTAILVHFLLEILRIDASPIIYYEVWVEDVLINSFLVAGLYVAVLLTIERYLLIRKPHKNTRLLSIESAVQLKIVMALLASLLLHLPMALQNTAKRNPTTGRLVKGNNQRLLCREPYWTIFNYYKMLREFLRFFCVVLLMSLNIVIAKSLQIAKKNRRLLIKRPSMVDCTNDLLSSSSTFPNSSTPVKEKSKRDLNHLMKSFTEKKLTALMAAICLIFVVGNVPQMVVMVVQNESLDDMFSFQVFRNIANTLEVLNHCLNFFIFCAASSEYTRAFLIYNCRFLRRCLLRVPCCARIIHARRLNSQCDLPSTVSDYGGAFANAQKRSTIVTVAPPHFGEGDDLDGVKKLSSCSTAIIYRDKLSPQQKRYSCSVVAQCQTRQVTTTMLTAKNADKCAGDDNVVMRNKNAEFIENSDEFL